MKKPICMECEHFIHKQKLKGYDGYCEVLKQFTVLSMGCSEFSEGRNKIYKKAPTVDAVEVVRCKDCKYSKHLKQYPKVNTWKCILTDVVYRADDYCSYGERKEE